ncbi:MAG: prepilin-type N-terminal cleavage/methylation domain-containing protein [Planctomycetes bacterium]|nr:prepilin-type N-terminal cleavage/methylation domain-containing protein [Planctomycetota bacterium]
MIYLPYRKRSTKGFTLVELMVVIGILGLLVGILAVAVLPQLNKAQAQMELKQMGDLFAAVQSIAANQDAKRKLSGKAFKDTQGRSFWEACFKQKVLDTDMLRKVVSLQTKTDIAADPKIADGEGEFLQTNCSYTSPKGDQLLQTLGLRGKNKCIALCFDSRNWMNAPNNGVLVSWTDGEQSVYIDAATAESEYQISKTEWESPAENIIGRKGPWAKTFEERGK